MSLAKLNPKISAEAGKEMRLQIAGLIDRKIYITVLGDDATVVQGYVDTANAAHFEENGICERDRAQKDVFFEGKLAIQVTAVRTVMNNAEKTERPEIEINDGEWLPAGTGLAKRIIEEDMRFVYEQIFAYGRNRSNFLPLNAAS